MTTDLVQSLIGLAQEWFQGSESALNRAAYDADCINALCMAYNKDWTVFEDVEWAHIKRENKLVCWLFTINGVTALVVVYDKETDRYGYMNFFKEYSSRVGISGAVSALARGEWL